MLCCESLVPRCNSAVSFPEPQQGVHEHELPQVTVGGKLPGQGTAQVLSPQVTTPKRHVWLAPPQVTSQSPVAEQLMTVLWHAIAPVQVTVQA